MRSYIIRFLLFCIIMITLLNSFKLTKSKSKSFQYLTKCYQAKKIDDSKYEDSSMHTSTIQWYPGHIAKAERELADYLKKVDVVIEVRDARIPLATTHPMVPTWVGNKPLIIAIARIDQISKKALAEWREYYTGNLHHILRLIYYFNTSLSSCLPFISFSQSSTSSAPRRQGLFH